MTSHFRHRVFSFLRFFRQPPPLPPVENPTFLKQFLGGGVSHFVTYFSGGVREIVTGCDKGGGGGQKMPKIA